METKVEEQIVTFGFQTSKWQATQCFDPLLPLNVKLKFCLCTSKKTNRDQWRTQKISEGGASFVTIVWRQNHVTSQINFRGSAEGTTNLGGSGGTLPGKFCKITPKNTHFCAFWKQVLDNTVFTFFYFLGSEGVDMAPWPPPSVR